MSTSFCCLLLALLCASAFVPTRASMGAPVRCFLRTFHEWSVEHSDAEHGTYVFVDVDVLAAQPVYLTLENIELSAVEYDRCTSSSGGSADAIVLSWGDNAAQGQSHTAFAHYPVHCHDSTHTLRFGVSSLGSQRWGSDARRVDDGTVFAPRAGEVDFSSALSATQSVREHAPRVRTLIVASQSHSQRTLLNSGERPIVLRTCMFASDVPQETMATHEWSEIAAPRLLPIATCIRQFGGHCGADIGYVNTLQADSAIALKAHTAANRLSPSSLENGFKLPSVFAPGMHLDELEHMHVGWACESAATDRFEEARWQLDTLTLHLGRHTRRCNDELMHDKGGGGTPGIELAATHNHLSALSITERIALAREDLEREQSYRASNDRPVHAVVRPRHAQPGVYHVPAHVAAERWQQAGVETARVAEFQALHDVGVRKQITERRRRQSAAKREE